jgi:hypothetical protein
MNSSEPNHTSASLIPLSYLTCSFIQFIHSEYACMHVNMSLRGYVYMCYVHSFKVCMCAC